MRTGEMLFRIGAAGILLLIAGFRAPPDSFDGCQGEDVITAGEIQEAGLVQLGDLFRLADGWTVQSVDEWTAFARPFGAAPGGQASWPLWIDGQPVPPSMLGPRTLDELPVPLHDVACVEVVEGPAWHAGRIVSGGGLHIRTHRPASRLSGRASYWTGNEVGDPGPLRYLGSDAPNVDHQGPGIGGSVGGAGLRLSGVSRIHFPTDPAQRRRIRAWATRYPKRHVRGGTLYGQRGAHRGGAFLTDTEDYVFVPALSRELPLRRRFGHAGGAGRVETSSHTRLRYSATYEQRRMRPLDRRAGPAARGQTHHGEAQVQAAYERKGMVLRSGVRWRGVRKKTSLAEDAYRAGRAVLFARWRQRGRSANVAWAGQLGTAGTWGTLLTAQWTPRTNLVLHARGGAIRQRAAARLLLEVNENTLDGQIEAPVFRTAFLALGGQVALPGPFEGTVRAFYRTYADLPRRRYTGLRYVSEDRAFSRESELMETSGHAAGIRGSVTAEWTPGVRQRLGAVVQEAVRGDEQFRALWRTRPRWKLHSRWTLTPAATFSLSAALAYQSSTYWASYAGASSQSEGRYRARVPASWRLDVTVHKSLWAERLHGSIVVRNALNQPYHSHPLGATFGLRLIVRVEVRI